MTSAPTFDPLRTSAGSAIMYSRRQFSLLSRPAPNADSALACWISGASSNSRRLPILVLGCGQRPPQSAVLASDDCEQLGAEYGKSLAGDQLPGEFLHRVRGPAIPVRHRRSGGKHQLGLLTEAIAQERLRLLDDQTRRAGALREVPCVLGHDMRRSSADGSGEDMAVLGVVGHGLDVAAPSPRREPGVGEGAIHLGERVIKCCCRRYWVDAASPKQADPVAAKLLLDLGLPHWTEQAYRSAAQEQVAQAGSNQDTCVENDDWPEPGIVTGMRSRQKSSARYPSEGAIAARTASRRRRS